MLTFLLLCYISVCSACKLSNGKFDDGEETVVDGAYVTKCTQLYCGAAKKEVVACVLPNGNRIPLDIPQGIDGVRWMCTIDPQGNMTIEQSAVSFWSQAGHVTQSVWTKHDCGQRGREIPRSCYTHDYREIPLNSQIQINGETVKCELIDKYVVVMRIGGKTICIDSYGYSHNVGSFWVSGERFNKTCKPSGHIEYVNCMTAEGQPIRVNQTDTIGAITYTCAMRPDGVAQLEEKDAQRCQDGSGSGHYFGSFWTEAGHFNKTCKFPGYLEIVNCVSPSGQAIPINGEVVENQTTFKCEMDENGALKYSGVSTIEVSSDAQTQCFDSEGNSHTVGSYWIENERYNKVCTPSGNIDVQNCLGPDSMPVKPDGIAVGGESKYACLRVSECEYQIFKLPKMNTTIEEDTAVLDPF